MMSEVIIPLNPPFSKGDERGIFYKGNGKGIKLPPVRTKVSPLRKKARVQATT
jgi:hypothetical protein